jgi:3D (Asp-Asp-Asp) domain-containing protein
MMDERAIRPYPPGNFEVDGVPYPTDIINSNFTVTWVHRDRLLEVTPPLIDHSYDGNIGPEEGTKYDIDILDDTNTVVLSYHDISGTSQTVQVSSLDDGQYTLQLSSIRDSLKSFQYAEWNFIIGYVSSTPMHDFLYDESNWTETNSTLSLSGDEYTLTSTASTSEYSVANITGLVIGKTYRFTVTAYSTSANSTVNAARVAIEPSVIAPVGSYVTVDNAWEDIYIEFLATEETQTIYMQCASVNAWGAYGDIARFKDLVIETKHATSTTGSNLISNGEFETDTLGWTAFDSTLAATDNELNITRTGNWYSAIQQVPLIDGSDFVLYVEKTSDNNDDYIALAGTASNNVGLELFGVYNVINAGLTVDSYEFPFTADENTYLWLGAITATSDNGVRKFDNISMYAATIEWTDVDDI